MRRVIITSYHEVDDASADELTENIRAVGNHTALVDFMRDHPPETIGFSSGGIRPTPNAAPKDRGPDQAGP